MTLQEKIDRLPLSIDCGGREYFLQISNEKKALYLRYVDALGVLDCLSVRDDRLLLKTSHRLECLVDRALTIIENEEWEQL